MVRWRGDSSSVEKEMVKIRGYENWEDVGKERRHQDTKEVPRVGLSTLDVSECLNMVYPFN